MNRGFIGLALGMLGYGLLFRTIGDMTTSQYIPIMISISMIIVGNKIVFDR